MINPFLCIKQVWDELMAHPDVARVNADDTVNTGWFVILGTSWVIIQLLSIYWFYLISMGMIKALTKKSGPGPKKSN
jgi:hypothetical protein